MSRPPPIDPQTQILARLLFLALVQPHLNYSPATEDRTIRGRRRTQIQIQIHPTLWIGIASTVHCGSRRDVIYGGASTGRSDPVLAVPTAAPAGQGHDAGGLPNHNPTVPSLPAWLATARARCDKSRAPCSSGYLLSLRAVASLARSTGSIPCVTLNLGPQRNPQRSHGACFSTICRPCGCEAAGLQCSVVHWERF